MPPYTTGGPFVPESPDRTGGVRLGLTPKRRRREVESDQFAGFVRRILAAYGRRAGADLDALGTLKSMRAELDEAITEAVRRLRNDPDTPASWAEIADQLGIKPQSAHELYGTAGRPGKRPRPNIGGGRKPGGQPAHLKTFQTKED